MKRLAKFLRSVLPADLAQLLLLFGVVFLFIAAYLRWCPWSAEQRSIKAGFWVLNASLIKFAACAGFFVGFRPGTYPTRRLLWWVCLPALAGELVMICDCYVSKGMGPSSLFEIGSILRHNVTWSLTVLSNFGPGFHYGLIGLVLIAVFTWRVALGSARLPLALPESSVSTSDDSVSWLRVQNFLWVFLALLAAIDWIYLPTMSIVGHFIYSHVSVFKTGAGVFAQLFVAGSFNLLIAVWMMGREGWNALRCSLRWPGARGLALAVAFPVGISALISVGQFLVGLLLWAANNSGRLAAPHIGSYFTVPSSELLLLLFFAFTEEIIFRGLLQQRFIRRYGLFRGMSLVGIAFAAAHLNGDFSGSFTDGLVILKLFVRLSGALPLSFVAGWLTLRTGSVLPAMVAHGLMNVLGYSPFGPVFQGIGLLIDLLWGALAYVLFRYWPVRLEGEQGASAAEATSEPGI